MKKQLVKLGLGIVFLAYLGSCVPDAEQPALLESAPRDLIPLAKDFFEAEKPNQTSIHTRLHENLEVYPKWEDAKTYGGGQMLIVPAYRNVRASYAKGYLRRFVFQLDQDGSVTRGGILELSGSTTDFLLENEENLISGYLNGIKSSILAYVWSDFGFNSTEGLQADGKEVTRSIDRLLNAKRGTESFSMLNCIDWYWVYSVDGVVIYEEYSHTTCVEASCDENTELACLDDGLGGSDGGGDLILDSDPEEIISYLEDRYGITLNQCEINWVYSFGYLAYQVWNNSQKALNETETMFGANGYMDCSDAYRHAYWSAINYRDVGPFAAISFGTAHECNTAEGSDKTMDLYNNNVGFEIGLNLPNGTDLQIRNAILTAMNNGELKIGIQTNPDIYELISSENCN